MFYEKKICWCFVLLQNVIFVSLQKKRTFKADHPSLYFSEYLTIIDVDLHQS
jgi:hypothetical protein